MVRGPAVAQPGRRSTPADLGPEGGREPRDGGLIATDDLVSLGNAAAIERSRMRLEDVDARFETIINIYLDRIHESLAHPVQAALDVVLEFKLELDAALSRNAALQAEVVELRRRLQAAISVLRG